MTQISRRNFLQQSTAAATGLGLFEIFPPLAAAGRSSAGVPNIKFPSRASDRIAVSTWSFREFIAGPGDDGKVHTGMTLEKFAADVRRKLGVPNIEPWTSHLQSREQGPSSNSARVSRALDPMWQTLRLTSEGATSIPTPRHDERPSKQEGDGWMWPPLSNAQAFERTWDGHARAPPTFSWQLTLFAG